MILTPYGVTFHPVVVIGLGKNLLFKSVLAHCGTFVDFGSNVQDILRVIFYDLKGNSLNAGAHAPSQPMSWYFLN